MAIQVGFLLPTSLVTAEMCVNSTEKSHDTTVFVAGWMVAVNVENNIIYIYSNPAQPSNSTYFDDVSS